MLNSIEYVLANLPTLSFMILDLILRSWYPESVTPLRIFRNPQTKTKRQRIAMDWQVSEHFVRLLKPLDEKGRGLFLNALDSLFTQGLIHSPGNGGGYQITELGKKVYVAFTSDKGSNLYVSAEQLETLNRFSLNHKQWIEKEDLNRKKITRERIAVRHLIERQFIADCNGNLILTAKGVKRLLITPSLFNMQERSD